MAVVASCTKYKLYITKSRSQLIQQSHPGLKFILAELSCCALRRAVEVRPRPCMYPTRHLILVVEGLRARRPSLKFDITKVQSKAFFDRITH